jgi:uncharacterized membrane protein YqiK
MYAAAVIAAAALVLTVVLIIVAKFYRKVDQGRALIVNTTASEPIVTFTGRVVLPIIHRAELMDISVRAIDIDRRGKEGLICKDNIRADIKVTFFVRVNKTAEDVLKVAQSIGCARASDHETLEQLFVAKFSEALKTVGKRLEFEELYTKRDDFRDQIISVIGKDLNGYVLDDAAIDYLEQTPLDVLDANNILDAHGIRKITEITAAQNVHTNELKQEHLKAITKQNLEAAEAILELERRKADAEAKQKREILSIRAREEAEALKVQAEERKKSELARIKQEEEVAISEENKRRQIEVAQKSRERAVGIEAERVEKDRQLEAITRERETELQRIEKEKALEVERKVIADVVAGRIAVEKHVAEEEERIKDLRAVAEAKRLKEATLIGAQAAAEEKVIATIKQAEAEEQVARHKAKEALVKAEADLEAADRIARGKMRIAEGTMAETAAEGLAAVKVKEADAIATEKMGLAEARVKVELLQAEAAGEESKGLATVRVREAEAGAIERHGAAEATAIQARMAAEAAGLAEKAEAMKRLDGEARAHEEFRMRLEKQTVVDLESMKTRIEVARQNAVVLGEAMGNAKINLVGGDGQFLDRFFKAVSVGHAVDGAVDNGQTLQTILKDYTNGNASLRQDLKDVLVGQAVTTETLKNLSVIALLKQIMHKIEEPKRGMVQGLLDHARELGLD